MTVFIIILYSINENAVLLDHTELNDVTGELHPLEPSIVVDINLLEQFYQVSDHLDSIFWRRQVMKHDSNESFNVKTLGAAAQQFVIIVDHLELAIVEMVHNIALIFIVTVLVHASYTTIKMRLETYQLLSRWPLYLLHLGLLHPILLLLTCFPFVCN